MATKEKNETILDKWNIFSEMPNSIDLEEIGTILSDKARGMKTIKKIHLTKKQKEILKNVFRLHNKDLSGRRPILLTLRDFETLLRITNSIVCSNFLKRRFEDGTVYAKDEDIDRAVKLYETIIDLKETVYCSSTRTIIDLKQKIYQEIIKANKGREVIVKELEKEVVKEGENGEPLKDNNGNPLGLCSRATLYRYIKELILDGTVKMVNRKPLKVIPI